MANTLRVIVTGFGPFHDIAENSSTIAVNSLQDIWKKIDPDTVSNLTVVPNIEVSYNTVDKLASEIWETLAPVGAWL